MLGIDGIIPIPRSAPDLSRADLFRGANLHLVDLCGADLREAYAGHSSSMRILKGWTSAGQGAATTRSSLLMATVSAALL